MSLLGSVLQVYGGWHSNKNSEFLMVSVNSAAGKAELIVSLGADGSCLLNFILYTTV